jgi:hypothetical protein
VPHAYGARGLVEGARVQVGETSGDQEDRHDDAERDRDSAACLHCCRSSRRVGAP